MKSIKSLSLLCVLGVVASNALAKKEVELVEWESPAPRFAELGLEPNNVADIIGEGQMVIVQPPKDIELWTKGEVKHYKGARFATAVTVIAAPIEEVRKAARNVEAMETFMPQIEDSSTIARDGKHSMAEWTQVFDLPGPLDLKAKFHMQNTEEPNGDMSTLLHKGDIDAAVTRWEAIKLSEDRTLVAFTYWGDLNSAGFAFKILLKSQPELIPSIPAIASSMITKQFKDHMEGAQKVSKKEMSNDGLPTDATIPMFSEGVLSQETLEGLSNFGTVLLVHPEQFVQGKKHPEDIYFVSAINILPGKVDQVRPISSNYKRIMEYFNWVKDVDVEETDDGKEVIDMRIKVAVGPVNIKVDNALVPEWANENTMLFQNHDGGDLDPLVGAWEYLPVEAKANGEPDSTMVILTAANEIGDDAGFLLKMMRKLPLTDLIMSLYMGMTLLEKQDPWIREQITVTTTAQN